MEKVYDVLDIARYIINVYNERECFISKSMVQNILFYVQRSYLKKKNKPCFNADIIAYDYGFLIPIVNQEFKKWGCGHIPMIDDYYIFKDNVYFIKKYTFDKEQVFNDVNDKKTVDLWILCFNDTAPTIVSDVTKNNFAWRNNYEPNKYNIVPFKDIKRYW